MDIGSCGSYKYMESPDFEPLLLAWAFDDEPVQLWDFTEDPLGEWPTEVQNALLDPDITKIAWNCAFEREVIQRSLFPTPPEQWFDVMHLAAQCGLPMSLDGAGKALGLSEDQAKMKEGKALIRFFCVPRRPRKGEPEHAILWNDPADFPDKWQTFRDYCVRDVEAERTIFNLLRRWMPNADERCFWCLDARINERGVRIDRRLAVNAVQMDQRYKAELTEQAIALTGMQNPKSVSQIKTWLADQEGKEFPSLNKKVVAEVVSQLQSDKAKEFMALRNELSKSSTAKYTAMIRSMTKDDHCKGCFLFYGANRTGRFCLTGDHEVLTRDGWVRLDAWTGGTICVWTTQSETLSFQTAERVSFPFEGELVQIDAQRCQQISTDEHKMPVRRSTGEIVPKTVGELIQSGRFEMPLRTSREIRRAKSPDALRVLIMVQADGHYTQDGDVRLGFAKQRKVERCRTLLRKAGIPYVETAQEDGYRANFRIRRDDQPLWLRAFREKTFGWWLLDEDADVVVDELEHWDAYRGGPNSLQYTTTNRQNADVIQALLQTSGYSVTALTKRRGADHLNWNDAYILNIWLNPNKNTGIRREQMKRVPYTGTVYCAVTPTGYFLTRRNGVIWITGNSGRLVQFQNMSKNYTPDLDGMRELVREGHYTALKALYDGVADPLSQLVRTAILPEEGQRLLISDFSAIEARVTAWFAGEEWRLRAFREGADIYCESASQMFHVPVVKHGVNGELRQKGKIAELALGYGGGVNALKAFGADKMGMSDEEMQETVDLWRASSPKIVALWRALEKAAIRCVARRVSTVSELGGVRFDMEQGILWMTLPSGRRIAYYGAQYAESSRTPDRKCLSYMGTEQQTRKWLRIETWGGKLTENLVQATARDCLRDAMLALDAAGFDIRAHVHDEVIVTEPITGRRVAEMSKIMGRELTWAPGLPLRADGYEGKYYFKD